MVVVVSKQQVVNAVNNIRMYVIEPNFVLLNAVVRKQSVQMF